LFSDSVIDRDGVFGHTTRRVSDDRRSLSGPKPPTPPAPTQTCQSTKAIIAQRHLLLVWRRP